MPTLRNLHILSPRYFEEVQVSASRRDESPMHEPESPVSPTPPRSIYREISSSPYHAYSASYSIPAESTSLITNMAVSSVRTVLPHSPTESGTHPSPRQYHSWFFRIDMSKTWSYVLALFFLSIFWSNTRLHYITRSYFQSDTGCQAHVFPQYLSRLLHCNDTHSLISQ